MKKVILVMLIGIIGLTASSQNCKYKRNEIDEFTGNTILTTKTKTTTINGMGFGTSSGVIGHKVNDTRYLKLVISSPSIFSIKDGALLMLKTSKGEIINIPFNDYVVAEGVYIDNLNMTMWTAKPYLVLSDEIYTKLVEAEIVKIRWYTTDGYFEDDVKKKHKNNISDVLKCIE